MAKFYISDLHLGHANVIKFDGRPFSSVEQMEKEITERWNAVVADEDDVYILGDMFWGGVDRERILKALKGNKHLILGNHDKLNQKTERMFKSVQHYKVVKDEGHTLILTHTPLVLWEKSQYGAIHLYGHLHNSDEYVIYQELLRTLEAKGVNSKAYNVGCMLDFMDYTPRRLVEIIEGGK